MDIGIKKICHKMGNLSVCLNVLMGSKIILEEMYGGIVGTYCAGDVESGKDEYLVFEENGRFERYGELSDVETGKYRRVDENVVELRKGKTRAQNCVVSCDGEVVYCYGRNGRVDTYKKLSDKPVFIKLNINPFR